MKNIISICCLMSISATAFAQEIKGISYTHEDWEIYCSNTGTCQAAGYSDEYSHDPNEPASLLLTRLAGAKQAVKAEFALGSIDEQAQLAGKLKIFISMSMVKILEQSQWMALIFRLWGNSLPLRSMHYYNNPNKNGNCV